MMDTYPDTFAVIYYHMTDGYETPWGTDRGENFYNIWSDGIPWLAYDGLFDAWPINTYETKFITRQAVPTDVTVALLRTQIGSDTFEYTSEVCVEAGGVEKTMRVYMVQVLDHRPSSPYYYRNCFMQAAQTEDIIVSPGECQGVTRTFTFDATSMLKPLEIEIISWAQEPLDGIPAEVHQAAKDRPFLVFANGLESGDTTSWSATMP